MARGAANPTLQGPVSASAFAPLLDFLYTGECSFDDTKLTEVLQAANFLRVAPLERAAVEALQERLSPSNALAAWSLADQLSDTPELAEELAEAAKEMALKGFTEVAEKIEEATLAQVQALVSDDRLVVKSEEAVFSVVTRFAEAKQPAEAELFGLLHHVRFPLMSREFLLETVRTWPMLDTKAGQALLFESMASPLGSPVLRPRLGFGGRFLYVMGGNSSAWPPRGSETVDIYDSHTNTWATGSPLPHTTARTAAAVLDGKIYVLGGGEPHEAIRAVTAFDPQTGVWQYVPPMLYQREGHTAVVVGGKLYAIGGFGLDNEELDTMEVFDPRIRRWVHCWPGEFCYRARAAVLGGKIYVHGHDNADAASFEVYDPATGTWEESPNLLTARTGFGMAGFDGKLYVAGGENNGVYSDIVEVFDPRTNTWASVAPMSRASSDLSLTVVRGKLFAVGGGTNASSSSAESYDPQLDRWEAVAPMPRDRYDHAAVAI